MAALRLGTKLRIHFANGFFSNICCLQRTQDCTWGLLTNLTLKYHTTSVTSNLVHFFQSFLLQQVVSLQTSPLVALFLFLGNKNKVWDTFIKVPPAISIPFYSSISSVNPWLP